MPLVFYVPGATPHHVPVKRSHIDVTPTVVDLMRAPPAKEGELSGQSLVPDILAKPGDTFEERDVYIDMPDGPNTKFRRGGHPRRDAGGEAHRLREEGLSALRPREGLGREARPLLRRSGDEADARCTPHDEEAARRDRRAGRLAVMALLSWIARVVLAAGGATLGAFVVALLEERGVAAVQTGDLAPAYRELVLADFAVTAPFAVLLGAAMGVFLVFLQPDAPRSPLDFLGRLRSGELPDRARAAALCTLVPIAALAYCVALANVSRQVLAREPAAVSGLVLGVVGVLAFLAIFGLVFAATPALAFCLSRVPPLADPLVTLPLGLVASAGGLAVGVSLGDTGGDGPTALAIFGVLARRELDLRPLGYLAILLLFAYAFALLAVRRPLVLVPVFASLLVVGGGAAATVHEATALNADERTARAVEQAAPLAKYTLALARTLTDRDEDGASPYFAGGDCNDHDQNIGPSAYRHPRQRHRRGLLGRQTPRSLPRRRLRPPSPRPSPSTSSPSPTPSPSSIAT